MKNILLFLNKPLPFSINFKKALTTNLAIGLFVALFLIVFQPFGISIWQTQNKLLKLFGFGIVSFLFPFALNTTILLLNKLLRLEDRWCVSYEITTIVIVLVFIAFGNMLYGFLLGVMYIDTSTFVTELAYVCLIGVFPVSLLVVLRHNKLQRLNLKKADEINVELAKQQPLKDNFTAIKESSPPGKMVLIAENGKDTLSLDLKQLLFIQSADNYSSIVFVDENLQIKKQLLRSSLKRIEEQLKSEGVLRCHRAFIVNLSAIKTVEGNAAGYKLYFYFSNEAVPVSRNYVSIIGEKLKLLKV